MTVGLRSQSDVVNAAFLTVEYLRKEKRASSFEEEGKAFVVELVAAGIGLDLARLVVQGLYGVGVSHISVGTFCEYRYLREPDINGTTNN